MTATSISGKDVYSIKLNFLPVFKIKKLIQQEEFLNTGSLRFSTLCLNSALVLHEHLSSLMDVKSPNVEYYLADANSSCRVNGILPLTGWKQGQINACV